MERRSKVALLLASTALLWIWQSSQPVWDKSLPFLDISDGGFRLRGAVKESEQLNNPSIIISVSEIIALYVGVATMASIYGLYLACSDCKATVWQNMAFTVLAAITSLGYGMHAVCVIAQDNPLHSLLDFVHERWSHNMFQFGMYSLLLLIIWVEKPHFKLSSAQIRTKAYTVKPPKESLTLTRLWMKWVGPVVVGLFSAIFSNRTETSGIALAFYVSVVASLILFMKHHKVAASTDMLVLFSQYTALGFFVSAISYGIPALFIHAQFFM